MAKKNHFFLYGINLIFCLDKWKEKLYYLLIKNNSDVENINTDTT